MSATLSSALSNLSVGVTEEGMFLLRFEHEGRDRAILLPLESARSIVASSVEVIADYDNSLN